MLVKKVLVIGSGGREHAICWKLSKSSSVAKIYALPGSCGIASLDKCENLREIDGKDFEAIASWCKLNSIDLVAVGPEDPLANGVADVLHKHQIRCFGPSKNGALIESDKKWSKDFMLRHDIPTAKFESFTDTEKAKDFIKSAKYDALVVKASGLAAGKGVVVAANAEEACHAVDEILGNKKYGSAGDVVVIEEKLTGEEISVLAFVDATTVQVMLPSQDHKRLKNKDEGPNTGGMGAYCPCPLISKSDLELVKNQVLQKAVDGLRKEGIRYCGVLYAGIMLTPNGPKVLEFNCRFGDPETQVILPLLNGDLYEVMSACIDNRLVDVNLSWKKDLSAVGVIMASAGYPETSTKGCIIEGIPQTTESQLLFHSGVSVDKSGKFVTNGGRVLIAISLNKNLKVAATEATNICKGITFSGAGAQFRTDIAVKAFRFQPLSYKDSGVDIDAGGDLVQRIKPLTRGTHRVGVVGGIGGFGGLFGLKELGYKRPVLCEATNGVGSKIKLALDCGLYESIGYDLFAVCANEVLESGAEPVAFLDYIACGKLQVPIAAQIVKGISEGCREANCALLGGETAEMPSVYAMGKYDIAGYCVGVLEESTDLPKFDRFEEGDLLIGLPSNGLHCAGYESIYELIQKLGVNMNDRSEFGDHTKTFGQEILQPTRIYVKDVLSLVNRNAIKAVANITSGLIKSLVKIIPDDFQTTIDFNSIQMPEVFGWLAGKGNLSNDTLLDNFNCGLGLVFVISKLNPVYQNIFDAKIIGELKRRTGINPVNVINFNAAVEKCAKKFYKPGHSTRTNVLSTNKFDNLKENINKMTSTTLRSETFLTQNGQRLTRIPTHYKDPVLVIGTDGVGTKIKIAQQTNLNSTAGIDLTAMCVNDILCNGAEPLTFLSYYACGGLEGNCVQSITSGIIEGSKQSGTSLIESRIVEVPLLYTRSVYDLSGFSLGITERSFILPRIDEIQEGDLLIGMPSSGVHSNGFSLIHKIMEITGTGFGERAPFSNKTYGEEFLIPTKIYVDALKPLIQKRSIKAIAHITGGGLIENIPRILTKDLGVRIDVRKFDILPVFGWLAETGNIAHYEMQRTYNCGIGAVLVVSANEAKSVMEELHFAHKATIIGEIVNRKSTNTPQVVLENFDSCLLRVQRTIKLPKKRVAVLISGSGTNLQALIDSSRNPAFGMGAEIALVISNKIGVQGLERAKKARIPCVTISHKDFQDRDEFDNCMTNKLLEYEIDLICLAGFMRILSSTFVKKWKGKLINIHPSLLPKHPGLHVQQKALDAGDLESGCTVHFVDEGVDTGAMIVQESVPILKGDTADILTKRIQKAEHYAFPKALKLVATGIAKLSSNGQTIFDY